MKPAKKTITVAVETTDTNKELALWVRERLPYLAQGEFCKVERVQVDRVEPWREELKKR